MVSFSNILVLIATCIPENFASERHLIRGKREDNAGQRNNIFRIKTRRQPASEIKCPTDSYDSDRSYPLGGVVCPMVYEPVECEYTGGRVCKYDNECLATIALVYCKKISDPPAEPEKTVFRPSTRVICPNKEVVCVKTFDPHVCSYQGKDCTYNNLCIAKQNLGPEAKCGSRPKKGTRGPRE